MVEFTSVLGSDRAIMDITLPVTIEPTTGHIIGIADIGIIATIIPIILGGSLIRTATLGWLEVNLGQPFFSAGTR